MHSVWTWQLAQHQHLELQKSSFSRVPVPKGLMIKPDQNRCDLKSTKLQFNNPFSRYWFQPTWLNLELVKFRDEKGMKRQRIWNHHLAIIPQHHCLLTPLCGQASTYNYLALSFFQHLVIVLPLRIHPIHPSSIGQWGSPTPRSVGGPLRTSLRSCALKSW